MRSFAILCTLLAGTVSANAQEVFLNSTTQGVFTAVQAKRGAAAYNSTCATCHGSNLRSADREVPHLTDRGYKAVWVGKTVGEKFEETRNTMPLREERSLSDQTYLDIIAYILQFNGAPAGKQELTPDLPLLNQITIADPAG